VVRGLRDGCFFLEIPAALDVLSAIELCRQFYRDRDDRDPATRGYRAFRELAGIYFDREHFQTEHVLIDGPGRARHFPPELIATCDAMNDVAMRILRWVLATLGVPERDWDRATGGAAFNRGTHWFAASHYRPERDQLGCAPHKDTGFVTVLYMNQPGLEARFGDEWLAVDPVPGSFLINFGGSFEILTRDTARPVQAILHRVRRIERRAGVEDRFSFAAFTNPPADGILQRYDATGALVPHQGVSEFLAEFNQTTWNDRHDDFGIK
jgi:isopenicillin N synthase-like dioxygenase